MRLKSLIRSKWLYGLCAGLICGICLLLIIDLHVGSRSAGRLYRDVQTVPAKPVALVLGTSKYVGTNENRFYKSRIKAAAELFRAGKVRGILVSGDNSRVSYNEPEAMKNDLVAFGVSAEYITLDFAGRRTLDSVVRSKDVFGQRAVVVVSQAFHCQRALYLADAYDLDAVCYVARDVPGASGLRIRLREVLARTRAFLDVNLLDTKPRFLGKLETVPLKPE